MRRTSILFCVAILSAILLPRIVRATQYDDPFDIGYAAVGQTSEGAVHMGKTDCTVGKLWARTVADYSGWSNIYSYVYDEGISLEDSPYGINVYGWVGGSLADYGDDGTGAADGKVSLWIFDEASQETVVYETIASWRAIDKSLSINEEISWGTSWEAGSGQYSIGVELWSHAGGGTDSAESDFYDDGYLLLDYFDVSKSNAGGFNFGRFRPLVGELVVPRTVEIQKGEDVELAFDLNSFNNYESEVQLDLQGLPDQTSYMFSYNPVFLAPNATATTYLRITDLPDPQDILPLTLTGTGFDGIPHSTSIYVRFREASMNPPVATFSVTPNPKVNQTIAFDASSSYDPDGTITNYMWDFGDGNNTSVTQLPMITHVYANAGNYSVILKVTDNDGLWNTTSVVASVTTMELHEILVTGVTPSKTVVGQNYSALIMVTVSNLGTVTETFNVTAFNNETAIPIYEQWPNSTQLRDFWRMGDVDRNGYIDYVDAGLVSANMGWQGLPGQNPADIDSDGTVDVFDAILLAGSYGYDIWTRLGIPYPPFGSQTVVTLPPGNSTIVTFRWNTTGVAKGIYTIEAYANPVSGETDTTDNTIVNGNVRVTIIGDINGDGRVDMKDVGAVAKSFTAEYNATDGWYWHYTEKCSNCPHSPDYDITGIEIKQAFDSGLPDGKINMMDISTVAWHFGEH